MIQLSIFNSSVNLKIVTFIEYSSNLKVYLLFIFSLKCVFCSRTFLDMHESNILGTQLFLGSIKRKKHKLTTVSDSKFENL